MHRNLYLAFAILIVVFGSSGVIASTKEDQRDDLDKIFAAKFYDGMRFNTNTAKKFGALTIEAPAPDPCTHGTISVPQIREVQIRYVRVACPKQRSPESDTSLSRKLLEGAAAGTILNFATPKSFNRHLFLAGPLCMGTGCPTPGSPPQ